ATPTGGLEAGETAMLEVLLSAVCVLTAVTVIGHGIWTALAWFLRGPQLNRETQFVRPVGTAACPRCGLQLSAGRCLACDWPSPAARARPQPLAALDALAEQVRQLSEAGVLDADALASVAQSIAAERERLKASATVPEVVQESQPATRAD